MGETEDIKEILLDIKTKMSNINELFREKARKDTEIKILLSNDITTDKHIYETIHDKLTRVYEAGQLNTTHKIILYLYRNTREAKQEYNPQINFSQDQLNSIRNEFISKLNNGELPYDFSYITTEKPDLFPSLIRLLKSDLYETDTKLSNAIYMLKLIYLYI